MSVVIYSKLIQKDADNMLQDSILPTSACYISTPGATTITNAGTYYVLQGVSTSQLNLINFTHASPGRLTYTGTITRYFVVSGDISIISSANNVLVGIQLAKNGTLLPGSIKTFTKTTAADTKTIPVNYGVQLATNEYIEMYVTCDSAGATITANNGTLLIHS